MASLGVFSRVARLYSFCLEKRPYATQAATSGVLWGLGDCLAQSVNEGPHDWQRTALTAAYGGGFIGPAGHFWYAWLDRFAAARFAPKTFGFVASKVLADTLICGPLHVGGYFAVMTFGEAAQNADRVGEDSAVPGEGAAALPGSVPAPAVAHPPAPSGWDMFVRKMRHDFLPTLAADVFVWPWIQSINFRFVPASHQLLYVNAFIILDSAFMSWCCANEGWFDALLEHAAKAIPRGAEDDAQTAVVKAQGT